MAASSMARGRPSRRAHVGHHRGVLVGQGEPGLAATACSANSRRLPAPPRAGPYCSPCSDSTTWEVTRGPQPGRGRQQLEHRGGLGHLLEVVRDAEESRWRRCPTPSRIMAALVLGDAEALATAAGTRAGSPGTG